MGQSANACTERGHPPRPLVALYGSSLMVAGMARRLAHHPQLRTVAIDGPTLASAMGRAAADALVVDLDTVPIEAALGLLDERPDLLLVGLEGGRARLVVLSGSQAASVGTEDLFALVEHALSGRSTGGRASISGDSRLITTADGTTVGRPSTPRADESAVRRG